MLGKGKKLLTPSQKEEGKLSGSFQHFFTVYKTIFSYWESKILFFIQRMKRGWTYGQFSEKEKGEYSIWGENKTKSSPIKNEIQVETSRALRIISDQKTSIDNWGNTGCTPRRDTEKQDGQHRRRRTVKLLLSILEHPGYNCHYFHVQRREYLDQLLYCKNTSWFFWEWSLVWVRCSFTQEWSWNAIPRCCATALYGAEYLGKMVTHTLHKWCCSPVCVFWLFFLNNKILWPLWLPYSIVSDYKISRCSGLAEQLVANKCVWARVKNVVVCNRSTITQVPRQNRTKK